MPLQQDQDTPGLWIDPALVGQPATHAIVIGVSAYPHLKNGAGPPAANNFGLGQLAVSAFTAYRFFEWLGQGYTFDPAPIGTVHLLLAPTPDELAYAPGMAGTFADADFATCEQALHAWRSRLATLGSAAADSRSVFFFSGHGLEISHQKQVLLPSDYLAPALPSVNRALSTLNMKQGLMPLDVEDQFFFIDACRNGSNQLGGIVVEGTQVFDVYPPDQNNDMVNSLAMYGTASGSQSWQPPQPSQGVSLYGEALLEAVSGGAPVDASEIPPTVWFNDVAAYTNQQIANLLRQRGARVRQTVKGDLGFVGLIHAAPHGVTATRSLGPTPAITPFEDSNLLAAGAVGGVAFKGLVKGDYVEPAEGWTSFDENANSHDWFGRETIEAVWMANTTATELRSRQELEIKVHGVDRFEVNGHRVRFSIDGREPVFLTIDAPTIRYGALLPVAPDTVFDLAMTWEGDELVQVDVDLSEQSRYPLDTAARLWNEYRTSDPAAAALTILGSGDLEQAVGAVQAKVETPVSPISAVVSSLVLLHAGQAERIPLFWTENMARLPQFDDVPDGAVIWAERLRRLGRKAPTPVEEALALLADRDLVPLTGDGVSFASAMAAILLETIDADAPRRAAIEAVGARLDAITPFLHSGGLFLVVAGDPMHIEPSLVYRG